MSLQNLIADIVRIISHATPLPDWANRQEVKDFADRIVPDLIDLGFDAGGLQAAHGECMALPPDELETLVNAALPPSKIGDGTLVKWLIANLPAILQIISLFVKQPAPAPTT